MHEIIMLLHQYKITDWHFTMNLLLEAELVVRNTSQEVVDEVQKTLSNQFKMRKITVILDKEEHEKEKCKDS